MSQTIGFRSPEEWKQVAKNRLDKGAFEYIQSGAGVEETLQANIEGFRRLKIVPRVLRDATDQARARVRGQTADPRDRRGARPNRRRRRNRPLRPRRGRQGARLLGPVP